MIKEIFSQLTIWLDPFFLLYFGSINFVYSILLVLGAIKVYRRHQELKVEDLTSIVQSNSLPEISFLMAAYNESANIISSIESLLHLSYRYKEIIVINDGSTDNTLELIQQRFQLVLISPYYHPLLPSKKVRGFYKSTLHPEIIVIDKENGGKFDALNAGLNACKSLYFITVDADTYVDDENFEAFIRPLFISPETIAVGASVRVRNGCSFDFNHISTDRFPFRYLPAMQSIEYLRAFLMRQGWDYLQANYIFSGAFAAFVTQVVIRAGGYAPTDANDLEIVFRLNRLMRATKTPYKMSFILDPIAWTEAPSKLKRLGRQRMLWHRGTLETLWFQKTLFFNPTYGRFGCLVYPFLLFGEALEPIIEILGYLYIIVGLFFGMTSITYVLLFFSIMWGFTFLFTLFCLLIEEISFRKYPTFKSLCLLFFYSLTENFGYRQLTLWWRLQGFKSFFKRFKTIKGDSREINETVHQTLKRGKFQW
jgi:cellulose synthase/poly-beta-1,6-N-acetylglucosamine synthase-like glycosyltransferase